VPARTSDRRWPGPAIAFGRAAGHELETTLYVRAVEELGGPLSIGRVTAGIWERFGLAEPGTDFTRILPLVEGA
jgi:hypothetical protein